MGGFDNYLDKQEFKRDNTIYTEQKTKGLSLEVKEHQTDQELIDKYETRILEESSFEERTRYYFEDAKMLEAKAERYKNISKDTPALDQYAQMHTNQSSKKRKDAAKDASAAFEKAATLQKNIPADAKGFALYKERAKVMRQRMKAMEYAATLKSYDKKDEDYRKLKSKLSCLTILKDQLDNLQLEADANEEAKFEAERVKLEAELEGVKQKIKTVAPSTQSKWEEANGLNEDAYKEKLETEKRKKDPVGYKPTMDSVKAMMTFSKFNDYYLENKAQMDFQNSVMGFGYTVKRDAQGNPIDATELKKAQWNEKLKKAVDDDDQKTRDEMIIESLKRFSSFKLPTPNELKKKGASYFFNQDPAGYFQIIKMAAECDDFLKDDSSNEIVRFIESQPGLMEKIEAADHLKNQLSKEHGSVNINLDINDEHFILDNKVRHRDYESTYNSMIQEQQLNKDKILADKKKESIEKSRSREIDKRKQSAEQLSADTNKAAVKNIKDSKEAQPKELKDYATKMLALYDYLGQKMPPIDFDDSAMEAGCMFATALYNDAIMSINTCLSKTAADGINDVVRAQLNMTKGICEKERAEFETKVREYRDMLIKYQGAGDDKTPTWYEALKYGRSVVYDLAKDKKTVKMSKQLGGEISDVSKIKTIKDGKENVEFFKKEDKVGSYNRIEMVQDFFDSIEAEEDIMQNIINPLKDAFLNDQKYGADVYIDLLTLLGPNQTIESTLLKEKCKVGDLLKTMDEKTQAIAFSYIHNLVTRHKNTVSTQTSDIQSKRNLSDRNVATSRLAALFGIQDIICKSKTANIVTEDGKLLKGIIMEESGGKSSVELKEKNPDTQISYSPIAINQIYMLQVFDVICGQCDRHMGNYHFTSQKQGDKIVLGQVKGIDNDLAFGNIKFKDLSEHGKIMDSKSEENLKGIPIQMVNTIMNLDRNTINIVLCDILQKDELDDMWDRIKGVQEQLKNLEGLKNDNGKYYYEGEDADDTLRQIKQLKNWYGKAKDKSQGKSLFTNTICKDMDFDKMIEERRQKISPAN